MKKAVLIGVIVLFSLVSPAVVLATDAQLACSPTTTTVNVGDTITTDIILNARGFQVLGADAIFTYTTGILDAATTDLTPVLTDTNWTAPTTQTVDSTLGKVELDYGSNQEAFTDSGTIGQIKFTAKQAGVADVKFVFFQEYDNTTAGVAKAWAEKVAGTKSNILTDTVDCSYTVTGVEATPTPGVPTSTPPVLPRTGGGDVTKMLIAGGAMVVLLGIGLKKIRLHNA